MVTRLAFLLRHKIVHTFEFSISTEHFQNQTCVNHQDILLMELRRVLLPLPLRVVLRKVPMLSKFWPHRRFLRCLPQESEKSRTVPDVQADPVPTRDRLSLDKRQSFANSKLLWSSQRPNINLLSMSMKSHRKLLHLLVMLLEEADRLEKEI